MAEAATRGEIPLGSATRKAGVHSPSGVFKRPDALQSLCLIAGFAVLFAVLFAAAMTNDLGYDEEQYIAAGYFARWLAPYRDFIAFQPPPYTWLLAGAFRLVGGWYLLSARIVVWLFDVGACMLLYALMVSYGAGRLAAFVLLLGFVTSPYLLSPLVLTRNDIAPLFLLLLGLWLCTAQGELTRSRARAFTAGVAIGLAAATKYLYLFAPPVLAAAFLYYDYAAPPDKVVVRWRRTAWFIVGAAIGGLPVLYALAENRALFVFQTLQFHLTAIFDWYNAQGLGEMLTLKAKVLDLPRLLVRQGNAAIFGILGLSALVVLRKRGIPLRHPKAWGSTEVVLVVLLAGALAFSIEVGPHAMYYAPVAALGALLAARTFAVARRYVPRRAAIAVLVLSLVPAWRVYQNYGYAVVESVHLDRWVGVQTHRSAERIAEAIARQGVSGHVATLFPILVLDANPVLPEFSAGPFFFRSAGAYSVSEIERLHGAGPSTIDRLFARQPPAAIVGDFGPFRFKWKPPMDAALIDYAKRAGYVQVPKDWKVKGYPNGQVWVRAPASRPRATR